MSPRFEVAVIDYRAALEAWQRCRNEIITTDEEARERWGRLMIHERELDSAHQRLNASIIDEMGGMG